MHSAAETERKCVPFSPMGCSEPDELGCSTVGRKVDGSSSKSQKFRKVAPKNSIPPLGRGGGGRAPPPMNIAAPDRPERCTDQSDVPLQRCLGRPLCGPPWQVRKLKSDEGLKKIRARGTNVKQTFAREARRESFWGSFSTIHHQSEEGGQSRTVPRTGSCQRLWFCANHRLGVECSGGCHGS